MVYLVEILKLIEAAMDNDRAKAFAYGAQLAEKLRASGEHKAAERINKKLEPAQQHSVTFAGGGLPVDSESRLSLADEQFISLGGASVVLDSLTENMVEEFILNVSSADLLISEGVGVNSSLLVHGPPGCGKTELGRFIAARLNLPLLTARTDTLISSYLGSTAKNLRLLFDHAASRPCILFLDEFDAIAKLRDDRHELGELKRVVVSLLQNIDALPRGTVLLAATNHEHLLDSAVWRRFAYRIKIGLPDIECRRRLFAKFLDSPVEDRLADKLAHASEGFSGSDIREICEASRRHSIINRLSIISQGDLFRRVILRTIREDGASTNDLIAKAKAALPHVYTHRILADAFDTTPSNISNILKKSMKGESANA
jgi:SpoVK/Ycf46/Vps4 family AAA+-type ATPase